MTVHIKKLILPSMWLKKYFTYEKYGGKVPIDIKLSKLIPLLWDYGIRTTSCCQSIRYPWSKTPIFMAWIHFYTIRDADKFIKNTSFVSQNNWFQHKKNLYFPKQDINRICKILK